jgi:hypothetical protein
MFTYSKSMAPILQRNIDSDFRIKLFYSNFIENVQAPVPGFDLIEEGDMINILTTERNQIMFVVENSIKSMINQTNKINQPLKSAKIAVYLVDDKSGLSGIVIESPTDVDFKKLQAMNSEDSPKKILCVIAKLNFFDDQVGWTIYGELDPKVVEAYTKYMIEEELGYNLV